MAELTLESKDSRGYYPLAYKDLIGSRWQHTGNYHIYTIVRWTYNGEDDTWMLVHTRDGSNLEYVRTPVNFFGNRGNGEVRYKRVS